MISVVSNLQLDGPFCFGLSLKMLVASFPWRCVLMECMTIRNNEELPILVVEKERVVRDMDLI